MEKRHAFLLALLITVLIALNTFILTNSSKQKVSITLERVIDGDTFTSNGFSYRLTNINTPEKSNPGYEEAKSFLSRYENKTVQIEILSQDKYGRTLVRAFSEEDYINLKIIEEGLGTKFLVQESEKSLFAKAESQAIRNERGIWKKSQYSGCIESEIFPEEELVALRNYCQGINIKDWTITDESRKKFKFPDLTLNEIILYSGEGEKNETAIFWNSSQNVWNNDRDTLYIFDSNNSLVHYNSYGY